MECVTQKINIYYSRKWYKNPLNNNTMTPELSLSCLSIKLKIIDLMQELKILFENNHYIFTTLLCHDICFTTLSYKCLQQQFEHFIQDLRKVTTRSRQNAVADLGGKLVTASNVRT